MARRQDRTLSVNIVGDIRDLKRSLSQVESSTRSTSQKLGQVGTVLKGAFGVAVVAQVGQVIGQLRDLGVEADAIRNRFEVVFGDSANSVAAWADEVNERFGVSVERVQDLANGVADLLVPLGFTREEAAGLTQETLQLANALSEWSGGNIDVIDSTERIRKALLGERESLEALGVKVLQSDVNARLAAEGNDRLTGAAKARAEAEATLAIITEKSADALDAYGNNANEALIAQKGLNAAIEDGKQSLADFVEAEVSSFNDELGAVGIALEAATEKLDEWNSSSADGEEAQRGIIESTARLIPGLRSTFQALDDVVEKEREAQQAKEDLRQATERAREAAGGFNPALGETAAQGANVASSLGDAVQSIKDLQAAERAAVDPVFALRQANDKLNEAFEKRVSLQAQGAGTGQINDAIQAELDAAQDLEFARQNLNDAGDEGLTILERYAEQYAIGADAIRAYKDEVLGLRDALNGLPNQITLPTVAGGSASIRQLEEELNRRGRATIE